MSFARIGRCRKMVTELRQIAELHLRRTIREFTTSTVHQPFCYLLFPNVMSIFGRLFGRVNGAGIIPNKGAKREWGDAEACRRRLDAVMRSQDPHNRIRCLIPSMTGEDGLECLFVPKVRIFGQMAVRDTIIDPSESSASRVN